jgi:hypothetical protein
MRMEDLWMCDRVVVLDQGAIGFRGGRAECLAYLEQGGLPLYGLALFVRTVGASVPGLAAELERGRRFDAEAVAGALMGRAAESPGG